MQYHIFVDGEFRDRIDPATLEDIEISFSARFKECSPIYSAVYYECRNIYLTSIY